MVIPQGSEGFYQLPNRDRRRETRGGKTRKRLRGTITPHPLKRGEWSQAPADAESVDGWFDEGHADE